MNVPVWMTILVAGVSGLASAMLTAILSPLLTSRLQLRNWRRQRVFELKYEAFQSAIDAITAYAADAMDAGLQSNKPKYGGLTRAVEMRPETAAKMDSARGLVSAFFSEQTYQFYDEAIRANISFETIPNTDFEAAKNRAFAAMAQELGLRVQ